MTIMPKLRHIAIAINDPKATAEFYKKAFGFEQIGETSPLASGCFLSDGTLNIAVLKSGRAARRTTFDKTPCDEISRTTQ
jgi:catechol 2,3-dioxygenase-like lactoylglutathione lyase family enzyme